MTQDNSKLNIEHFEQLALKWWYEKSKDQWILKYHPRLYDRNKDWFFERIFISIEKIVYIKYKNPDFTKQIDYCHFSANFINSMSNINTVYNYIY